VSTWNGNLKKMFACFLNWEPTLEPTMHQSESVQTQFLSSQFFLSFWLWTVRHYDHKTLWFCDSVIVWLYNDITIILLNFVIIWYMKHEITLCLINSMNFKSIIKTKTSLSVFMYWWLDYHILKENILNILLLAIRSNAIKIFSWNSNYIYLI